MDGFEGGVVIEVIEVVDEDGVGVGIDLVETGVEVIELKVGGKTLGFLKGRLEVVVAMALERGACDMERGRNLSKWTVVGDGGVDGGAIGMIADRARNRHGFFLPISFLNRGDFGVGRRLGVIFGEVVCC